MQDSISECDVGAWLKLKMQISLARCRRLAWIDDYPEAAVVALRSMPNALLFPAAAETMQSRPL